MGGCRLTVLCSTSIYHPADNTMAKILSLLLLCALSAAALAAPGVMPAAVEKILEQHRQHGFDSPAAAIHKLEALRGEVGPGAPMELRAQYHNELAMLYISAEDTPRTESELQQLGRMAIAEQCDSCRYYKLIREVHWAVRRQDGPGAQRILAQLDALPAPTDRSILQAIEYWRGGVSQTVGDHDQAITHGLRAARLAQEDGNPAEQIRALNLLLLANVSRRDLKLAEKFADEAYALADKIGFIYMKAYLRANQAWIYSLADEPAKQLQALTDGLRITRSQPGMGDVELINLINLAEYHGGQKDFSQAADLANQAISVAEQQGKPNAKAIAMLSLGNAQVELGQVERGLSAMRESIRLLESLDAKNYVIDATNQLANVYEKLGRNGDALTMLRKATALKEAAITEERDKVISAAQEEFSAERKDHEIQRLSLENARRDAEVAARTWKQRLWAAAAVGLALGGGLLIQLLNRSRNRNRVLEDSNATLNEQSVLDPLTGAFNRRHCHTLMGQQEALIAGRPNDRNHKACVGLMVLDLDHFKLVNDSFGHAGGDVVLVEIAQRLQDLVRQQDTVVRWGGEEFVLVLPGTAPAGMLVLVERVLSIVGSQPVMVEGKPISVTVSVGCATFPLFPGQSWEDSLQVADFAMYLAKSRGRNRAVCVMQAEVTAEAQATVMRGDLADAQQAGQVVLQVIEGPLQ